MSRFSKYLVGAVLFVAGAASVSTMNALVPRPADPAGGAAALSNPAVPLGSNPLLQETSPPRAIVESPGTGKDLIAFPAYEPRIELTGASLLAAVPHSESLATPVFDFAAAARAHEGAEGHAGELSIAVATGGPGSSARVGAGAGVDEGIGQGHSGGPATWNQAGTGLAFGIATPAHSIQSGDVGMSGSPLVDHLPTPVPLPAAAFSGVMLLAACSFYRALRRG